MRIHLGANSRPISFEYYTENQSTQQTTSATYYYHYDLHGNVIRVTNSSGTTVITYTYDPLGNILTESNSNSIYNPFTYMGEAQVIHDSEFDTSASSPLTGLYNAGSSYYNPETGTFLSGTGAPASTNPTSTTMEEPATQNNNAIGQLAIHSVASASTGSLGANNATPASSQDIEPETSSPIKMILIPPIPFQYSITVATAVPTINNMHGMGHDCWERKWKRKVNGDGFEGEVEETHDPMPYNPNSPFPLLDAAYNRYLGGKGFVLGKPGIRDKADNKIPDEVRAQLAKELAKTKHLGWDQAMDYIDKNLEFVAWGWKACDYESADKKI